LLDDDVFTLDGKPVNQNTFIQVFRRVRLRMKLPDMVPHDLRHTYVKRKRQEGWDRSVIMRQTGHKTESMFHWYNDIDTEEIQEMSGTSRNSGKALLPRITALVKEARKNNVSLGAVQILIGQTWSQAGCLKVKKA